MMFRNLFILTTIILLSACSGEENTSNGSNDGINANDTTADQNETVDSTVTDQPFSLLKDTINGQINEMVFQREDGLRIEW